MVLRRAGVVLIVVMLGLGIGGAVAGVKKHKWPSQVSLTHPSSTQFSGAVTSKFTPCRSQRLVTLYYTDPITGQTQPLSVQRTDKFGKYRIDLTQPAYAGKYQAQVPKVSKRRTEICRAGQSTVISVTRVPPAP
jgi:hypothetical protein